MDLNITADHVNAEVRGIIDTNDADTVEWVETQVSKATRRLLATCPTLKTRLSANPDLWELARDVVIAAVGRMARNSPTDVGIKSESEDGYSYTIDPLTRAGDIWFPDKDLSLLGCGAVTAFVPQSARLTPGKAWAAGNYGTIRRGIW